MQSLSFLSSQFSAFIIGTEILKSVNPCTLTQSIRCAFCQPGDVVGAVYGLLVKPCSHLRCAKSSLQTCCLPFSAWSSELPTLATSLVGSKRRKGTCADGSSDRESCLPQNSLLILSTLGNTNSGMSLRQVLFFLEIQSQWTCWKNPF